MLQRINRQAKVTGQQVAVVFQQEDGNQWAMHWTIQPGTEEAFAQEIESLIARFSHQAMGTAIRFEVAETPMRMGDFEREMGLKKRERTEPGNGNGNGRPNYQRPTPYN